MIGFFSPGIGRLRHLDELLGSRSQMLWFGGDDPGLSAVAGWGLKPTSAKARRFAAKFELPYLSLEDGFLRSLGLGVHNAPIHSLIVDKTGIYYDATRASDLETLIIQSDFSTEELGRAWLGMDLLRRYRLSKYNHAPDVAVTQLSEDKSKVLVVDQTEGDASIEYGLADANSFTSMLESARIDNPDSEILVKIHPDVIAGKKAGHLLTLARECGCTVIDQDLSPWALLDVVDKVYVVTSQLGFEALLAGKQVYCFGAPFYSGWGLTQDQKTVSRRKVTRSITQLFAAAYLRYCRYINPYTGVRCEFEQTLSLLADQKRQRDQYRGRWLGINFGYWKKGFVGSFLGKNAQIKFSKAVASKFNAPFERVLVWSSDTETKRELEITQNRLSVSYMEDGFIRSVGLGADAVEPLSLVIDAKGIYYDATRPSELECLLQDSHFSEDLILRAQQLRKRLVMLKVSKYNVGAESVLELPKGRRIILVPGQVETDASIRMGSYDIKTNAELLCTVRQENPEAFIIYKPHPDVLAGARLANDNFEQMAANCDLLITDIAMPELLEKVNEVHTLTSLTGFEALMRGLTVFTYGMPFYAGWGLTTDRHQCARRTRHLNVDQLVAGSLILYPVYIDPGSGDQVNAETAIDLIHSQRLKPARTTLNSWVWQRIRKPD
ncbi:capsular polysaccharide biosynthesis protein [Amphritea japonica]|uniref:Capsular polysaccharide export protein n=1 Tax=Amphritea japonica ATCC BAA-1530 TaxID=1278309 RepID=A0A7R6P1G3_9GAMM|nr:capsular polysaccharide biosynthesis protein [Amphritea japonica]BBB25114.1 capsular polysaccharide export protein [Amphritea japonica ATCC BAA-1530]